MTTHKVPAMRWKDIEQKPNNQHKLLFNLVLINEIDNWFQEIKDQRLANND